eukprot:TRINITY_DN18375_c0_g1_i1.p1 TRINITY_DN18375_c0_g1~~TRINITY_DN18375_c0_g1_i1.p1  ORF type:complete len:305 (-),score=79.00 TRINITY_DN18375_c0_g1_i1:23-877(-)
MARGVLQRRSFHVHSPLSWAVAASLVAVALTSFCRCGRHLGFVTLGLQRQSAAAAQQSEDAPQDTDRRAALLGMGLAAAAPGAAGAVGVPTVLGWGNLKTIDDDEGKLTRIVDEANILSGLTQQQLEKTSQKLSADTGVKLFVLAPPSQLQKDKKKMLGYIAFLRKELGMTGNDLLLMMGRGPPKSATEYFTLKMGINRGLDLTRKYDQITSAHDNALEKAYSEFTFLEANGLDVAALRVAENMAACIYLAMEDPTNTECSEGYPSPERVKEVLDKHEAKFSSM